MAIELNEQMEREAVIAHCGMEVARLTREEEDAKTLLASIQFERKQAAVDLQHAVTDNWHRVKHALLVGAGVRTYGSRMIEKEVSNG